MANKQSNTNAIKKFATMILGKLNTISLPSAISIIGGAVVFSTLSILTIATDFFEILPDVICYIIYIAAVICLFLATAVTIAFFKQHSMKQIFLLEVRKKPLLSKMIDDFSYRTMFLALGSLFLNTILTVFKLATGWYYGSVWSIALSGYYIVLIISKFMMIQYGRKKTRLDNEEEVMLHEWRAYRLCGIMLLFLTFFLQGVVTLIVANKDTQSGFYNENIMLIIAAYDFYCLGNSIVYMITKRKNYAPIVNSIKAISFASSLVSILSLQAAMFATFGKGDDLIAKRYMNIATGTVVCVVIIMLGIMMILKANKEVKLIQLTEETNGQYTGSR